MIACQHGETLMKILDTPASDDQVHAQFTFIEQGTLTPH